MDPRDVVHDTGAAALHREQALDAAVEDGRLVEASLAGWRERWDKAPKATEKALAGLAPGIAPSQAAAVPEIDADEAYRQLTGRGREGGVG